MPRIIIISLLLLIATQSAFAAISSKDHPRLKKTLEKNPDADTDEDGVLSFLEYQAFQKKQGPRKRPNGGEAGPISTLLSNGDLLICDFEENNFGRMRQWGWTIEGDSFARDLAFGTKLMKRRAATLRGKYLLSSFAQTDEATGKIVSPSFEIELKYIQFQLSGGDYPGQTCVNIVVEDKVVRSAAGNNRDRFKTVAFDVTTFQGQQAKLEIVDTHTGIWGHINVDHIVQTDNQTAKRVISQPPIESKQGNATVQTVHGHHSGMLAIKERRLSIDKQTIAVDDILLAIGKNATAKPKAGSVLRLANGEIWHGQLLGLEDGKVLMQNEMFARREVPLKQIASIEFKSGSNAPAGEPGTLYRDQGEPIPGKLVWIREKDVAIDCVLGVVPVPRASIQRFVVAARKASTTDSQDEVKLVDGSLLRGELTTEGEQLVLKHSVLGSLNFPWSNIQHIRRTPTGAIWLDSLKPEILEQVGPVLPPPSPTTTKSQNGEFLRAICMMPRTVTQYQLPTTTVDRILHATLSPIPNSRSDVNVRVKSGDQTLLEKKLSAGSKPTEVAINLKQTTKFTIEIDFSDQLTFPCGVDWRDAYIR